METILVAITLYVVVSVAIGLREYRSLNGYHTEALAFAIATAITWSWYLARHVAYNAHAATQRMAHFATRVRYYL